MVAKRQHENPEQRKLWLRSLRAFKAGMHLRAKMGVIAHYCHQVGAQRRASTTWSKPDWDKDKWITLLYTSIRDNQLPPELIIAFAETPLLKFESLASREPTVEATLNFMDYICKAKSYELRRRFGVFDIE